MKVKELRELLNNLDSYHDEDQISIPLSIPSIGATAKVDVVNFSVGFDWDNKHIFLSPKEDLVVKSENQELWDRARDLLMYLATKPIKKHAHEVASAKRIMTKFGITEEQLQKYASIYHKEKTSNEVE